MTSRYGAIIETEPDGIAYVVGSFTDRDDASDLGQRLEDDLGLGICRGTAELISPRRFIAKQTPQAADGGPTPADPADPDPARATVFIDERERPAAPADAGTA
jgi:hypothetical protein